MNSKDFKKKVFLLCLLAIMVLLPVFNQGKALFVQANKQVTEQKEKENLTLKQKMDEILNDERLAGTVTGISIRQAKTGKLLYSRNGDTRLHPASNMKLLTSAAALDTLGQDYRFTTELWTDGVIKGNVLHGNLYLKGKGDPTLLKQDFVQFAMELKHKGIRKIEGNLIGDDTWYDDIRLSQDLNWSDESFYTGAQISALTLSPTKDYNAGTIIVKVSPASKIGNPAKISILPKNDYITVVNKTETAAENKTKTISIEREHGSNHILIRGMMPVNEPSVDSWVAVWEPTGYALDVFKNTLKEKGIKFTGSSKVKADKVPEKARLLTSKDSIPLKELLIPFMKLSNNGIGEVLTKEMGKVMYNDGSWNKGLQVTEEFITKLGLNPETILLRDGSGMSHKNYIPANELSQMLFAVQEKDWFPAFEYALPVAGEPERFTGGTLRHRMTSNPVKENVTAKTGTLTSVSTLSGYVTSLDGEKLIFSIMINNYLGSTTNIKQIEDTIAMALARHTF